MREDWIGVLLLHRPLEGFVYAVTPQGELICCLAADGKEVWRKHLMNDFGGKKGDGWGYSESPLLDGDRVICTPGGDKATMVALNGRTGELIWKTVRPDDRGAGRSRGAEPAGGAATGRAGASAAS